MAWSHVVVTDVTVYGSGGRHRGLQIERKPAVACVRFGITQIYEVHDLAVIRLAIIQEVNTSFRFTSL